MEMDSAYWSESTGCEYELLIVYQLQDIGWFMERVWEE